MWLDNNVKNEEENKNWKTKLFYNKISEQNTTYNCKITEIEQIKKNEEYKK